MNLFQEEDNEEAQPSGIVTESPVDHSQLQTISDDVVVSRQVSQRLRFSTVNTPRPVTPREQVYGGLHTRIFLDDCIIPLVNNIDYTKQRRNGLEIIVGGTMTLMISDYLLQNPIELDREYNMRIEIGSAVDVDTTVTFGQASRTIESQETESTTNYSFGTPRETRAVNSSD